MARFTVDTHLFRELGELLVGRDSTALIELIKNAYDADATEITVYGERLDKPDEGRIFLVDNGSGMDAKEFENGFLRVASRLKEEGDRRSTRFRRRYTGAKGIGRLAAHKLARKLEIGSVPNITLSGQVRESVQATIDWDEIERFETLDDLESTDAIVLKKKKTGRDAHSGTTLVLSRLRRAWTQTERARFFAEVQSFGPPKHFYESLPSTVIDQSLLFATPIVRDQGIDCTGSSFAVRLEGEFASGEDYWKLIAGVANWVLEIRASSDSDRVDFAIAPTKMTLSESPEIRKVHRSIKHPTPSRGPHFDARILVREGTPRLTRDQRVWATNASGIRVYMEGFRVLPYGEPKDDWLSLDSDYTRRPRQLEMLKNIGFDTETDDPDVGLVHVPNNNYFGAVFLTQDRCPDLRLLVNREGFVPEAGFDTLVKIVRTGIDFLTRERAAAYFERRQRRRAARLETRSTHELEKSRTASELPDRIHEAMQLMKEAGADLTGDAKDTHNTALLKLDEANEIVDELISEHMLLYVLASVGTQMAAFVHEINALLGAAQTIERALERILAEEKQSLYEEQFSSSQRSKLRHTLGALTELRRGLELQASYLTDVVTTDALRRRSRQRLQDRFDSAVRLVQHEAELRNIIVDNNIPTDLRTLPMFSAELTTVFANLLTNAVKAAGEGGRIRASAFSSDDQVRILIQNTGTAVHLDESEKWFKPFQSTTTEVNSVLGQGMGLGLTITRNLLKNYGATVRFVKPDDIFSTAIEISLPVRS